MARFRPERVGSVSMMACSVEGCGNAAAPTVEGVSFVVRLFGTAPVSWCGFLGPVNFPGEGCRQGLSRYVKQCILVNRWQCSLLII